jgi:hypothetical protein
MRVRNSVYSFISKRINLILTIDIFVVILFSVIYYNLQFWIRDSFVRSTEETEKLPKDETFFTFLECLHFSVVTQTTLGYGDMIPTGNIPVFINTIQIISLYAIPFLVFYFYNPK